MASRTDVSVYIGYSGRAEPEPVHTGCPELFTRAARPDPFTPSCCGVLWRAGGGVSESPGRQLQPRLAYLPPLDEPPAPNLKPARQAPFAHESQLATLCRGRHGRKRVVPYELELDRLHRSVKMTAGLGR